MNASWQVRTGRLWMRPVGWGDLADLVALKGDPRAFAMMLGGVRQPAQVADELARDISDWSRLGYGIWSLQHQADQRFLGIAGLQDRPDGQGVGLRFALLPQEQGHGFASEAASAALRFGHEQAALETIVAVARADNLSSRQVLGSIGMTQSASFVRDGVPMLMFQSRSPGGRAGVS